MNRFHLLILLACCCLALPSCTKEQTKPRANTTQISEASTQTPEANTPQVDEPLPNELRVDANEQNQIPMTFAIDEELLNTDQEGHVSAAWLGYAMSRGIWIKDHFTSEDIKNNAYTYSFDEEVEGRQGMAQIWMEFKEKTPQLTDAYLDKNLAVRDAGFMREYVWVYRKDPSWTTEPEGLRLEEFKTWQESNLADHTPQTRASVRIDADKIK